MKTPPGWKPKYRAPIRNWYTSKRAKSFSAIMCHEQESIPYIQEAVVDFGPEVIVELGTAMAGFTLVLHEAAPDAFLFSFDKYNPLHSQKKIWKFLAKRLREIQWPHGILEYQRQLIEKTMNSARVSFSITPVVKYWEPNPLVVGALSPEKKTFLYCDNGSKTREVILYAPLLKPGDMLGVHDWEDSVDQGAEGFREVIDLFEEHKFNEDFIREGLRTRLFFRR